MAHKTYLPSKDAELVAWGNNFTVQVAANAAAWEITTTEVTDLQRKFDNFQALFSHACSPEKTSIIVAQKNEAREIFKETVRGLVNFRLRNPVITADQRIALGLHVRKTKPSPIPVPATRPELDIDVLDVRRLKIHFRDMYSSSKAKPYGISGAVIIYAALDTPPADHNMLMRSTLATRTPYTLEFTEEERGKTVYVACCWQNKKGKNGPWSEIESAIVP
ncbi:MAG: hypothetical protein LBQ28_01010 [Prevotellaceae bacterium]|jgi:hypothetical protein|nr:hypothetical protein [Prevotellaceae bacterium]